MARRSPCIRILIIERKLRKWMNNEKAYERSPESPWTVWCSKEGTVGSRCLLTNASNQNMGSHVAIVKRTLEVLRHHSSHPVDRR